MRKLVIVSFAVASVVYFRGVERIVMPKYFASSRYCETDADCGGRISTCSCSCGPGCVNNFHDNTRDCGGMACALYCTQTQRTGWECECVGNECTAVRTREGSCASLCETVEAFDCLISMYDHQKEEFRDAWEHFNCSEIATCSCFFE